MAFPAYQGVSANSNIPVEMDLALCQLYVKMITALISPAKAQRMGTSRGFSADSGTLRRKFD